MKLREIAVPVTSVSGVGNATAKLLSHLSIFSVGDLLSYWPRAWEDRTKPVPIARFAEAKVNTIAKVVSHDWFGYGAMRTLKVCIEDGTASADLVCFNRPFLEKSLPVGALIRVYGTFSLKFSSIQSTAFDAERVAELGEHDMARIPLFTGNGVQSVYSLTAGLTNTMLRKIIARAMSEYGKGIENELPPAVIEARGLFDKAQCVKGMHRPASIEEAQKARYSLIFEELYLFQSAIGERSLKHRGKLPDESILLTNRGISDLTHTGTLVANDNSVNARTQSDSPTASNARAETLPLTDNHVNASARTSPLIDNSVNARAASSAPNTESATNTPNGAQDASQQPRSAVSGTASAPDARTHTDNAFLHTLSPKQHALFARLPFALTADQKTVIAEMNADIDASYAELLSVTDSRAATATTAPNGTQGAPQQLPAHPEAATDAQITTGLQTADTARAQSEFSEKAQSAAQQKFSESPKVASQSKSTATAQVATQSKSGATTQVAAQSKSGATAQSAAQTQVAPPYAMARLLQGDVGSGKTLAAFFACLRVADYGGQSAILAPTELLAKQHAENAAAMLEALGVRLAFLTGNIKAAGRSRLLSALKNGDIDIVIGTHALFSQNVQYKDLRLAVVDEQHRFGVLQRNAILEKGRKLVNGTKNTYALPNLLMMSATPIPQTLALSVFGDLDISTIRTMPQGRLAIKTHLTKEGSEENVYNFIKNELAKGRQAYFVYPLIEQGDTNEDGKGTSLKSAEEMFEHLSRNVFPRAKCALIHSRINEDEQHRIMSDFKSGAIQILVATSVVEVGVDVANATCMVIEHAERFGLAALHQLRGRVGRSNLQSHCFLVYSKNLTEEGKARLKALFESTDGFYIAEQDLLLRGPGEVLGVQQSGYLTLSIADPVRDKEIMMTARDDAFNQLREKLRL